MKVRGTVIDTAIVIAATLGLLLTVNAGCWFVLARYPLLSEPPAQRITREYNQQFYARQASLVTRCLALKDRGELQAFLVENSLHSQASNIYEDFTMFRPAPWHGRFFNFTDAGSGPMAAEPGLLQHLRVRRLDRHGHRPGLGGHPRATCRTGSPTGPGPANR